MFLIFYYNKNQDIAVFVKTDNFSTKTDKLNTQNIYWSINRSFTRAFGNSEIYLMNAVLGVGILSDGSQSKNAWSYNLQNSLCSNDLSKTD